MNSTKSKNQKKKTSTRRPRRKTKVVIQRVVRPAASTRPRRRNRRRNGRARDGYRQNGVGIQGVGIMKGGEIVNARTHSAPEIREGEELISTVLGSTGFATTQFNINPANSTTFPWLSKIAQLFERYEFEALSFHFGHDVSGFAVQGQTGLVYLSALYDAASAAPGSVTQIEATDPFVPCMPNQDSCCRLDKKSMHPANEPKYCLTGNPPGATDIKTYNVGSLFVTTTGMANTTEIGKLRVRYRVRLFDRLLDNSITAPPANFSVSISNSTALGSSPSGTPFVLPFASAQANGLALVNTAGSILLPAGNYLSDVTVSVLQSIVAAPLSSVLSFIIGGVLTGPQMENESPGSAAQPAITSMAISQFVSVDGKTPVTIQLNNVFASGAPIVQAQIRFTAV